ncbi:unnamed protein product [Diplocarpon coronariae]
MSFKHISQMFKQKSAIIPVYFDKDRLKDKAFLQFLHVLKPRSKILPKPEQSLRLKANKIPFLA